MKIYIGYVVEIVRDNNDQPTLELKVRVPAIHGISSLTGTPDEHLPIAKPLITPGILIDTNKFVEFITNLNKVYIVFESGNFTKPIYLGIVGNKDVYSLNDWTTFFEVDEPEEGQVLTYDEESEKWVNTLLEDLQAIKDLENLIDNLGERIDGLEIGSGNDMKEIVVKATEPTEVDYKRESIPDGSIWVQTIN